MKNKTCTICSFLIATKGNWRNSIYIECGDCPYNQQCSDFLMAPDSDGLPVIIPVSVILKMTGMAADKSECLSVISRQKFESLYSSWLDWQASNPNACAVYQTFCHTGSQCDFRKKGVRFNKKE